MTRRATGCRCWSILLALGLALLWASSAHAADAFTQISASLSGGSRTCGVKADGTLECWGASRQYGQTNAGTFKAVSTGGYHAARSRPTTR